MIELLDLSNDPPYKKFQSLYEQALDKKQPSIEAMSVSSYDNLTNEVEARYVNLKYIKDNKWIFFSNYLSPKANQFKSHEQISILIYWAEINTQIRIKAKIQKTSSNFSDQHFQSRSKEKNALAISSKQSKAIDSFDTVETNFKSTFDSMSLHTKRPEFWGGYFFIPYYFEFWQGHTNRLNKREVYFIEGDSWKKELLQP
jgi:pyridoxamine 5'-phosphate oxidase